MMKEKEELEIGDVITMFWREAPDVVWEHVPLRVEITGKYPKYYTGVVLPHRNPYGWGEMSKPYPVTISRPGLFCGDKAMDIVDIQKRKEVKTA